MYTLVYFTLLVCKLWQSNFPQKLQNGEGGTILKLSQLTEILYTVHKSLYEWFPEHVCQLGLKKKRKKIY